MNICRMAIMSLLPFILGGCDAKPPEVGDTVTYKVTEKYAVKAIVNQKRSFSKAWDGSARKNLDQFIGQYYLDEMPEAFPKISKQEMNKLPWPPIHLVDGSVQFVLQLNDLRPKPLVEYDNYRSDQIVVSLSTLNYELSNKTTREDFIERKIIDVESLEIINSLSCYLHSNDKFKKEEFKSYYCFKNVFVPYEREIFLHYQKCNDIKNSKSCDNPSISVDYVIKDLDNLMIRWVGHSNSQLFNNWESTDNHIIKLIQLLNVSP